MRKHLIAVSALAFALAAGAGAYSTNVQANAETNWEDFKITSTAVRLGEANSKENPTGLRFKVDCPEKLEGAEFYTTVTLTPAGATESTSADVPATVWRSEGDGWNTVLLAIPDTDYGTVVSATAYVAVDGAVVHTSNTVSSSIAETSATLLAGGATDEALYTFVDTVVSEVTLDKASASLKAGESVQLAVTEPAGYAVAWSSDNEAVATVDANGNVTAVAGGSANITAKIGSKYATCAVTVSWADTYDFENGSAVSALDNVAGKTNWEVVTLADGNNVLNVKECTFNGEAYIQNPKFAFNVNYINWIFDEHDYFTWTIYSDVPYIRYLYDNADGSPYQSLYGYHSTNMYYAEGTPVTVGEDTLYKFALSYNKDLWDLMVRNEYTHSLRIAFTEDNVTAQQKLVMPEVLYFDDIQAGDYTMNVINFEDGRANPAIQGGKSAGAMAANVVGTTAANGNYAVKVDANSNQNRIVVDSSYLHYVFNEMKADALRFKWYSSAADATTAHSFRIYVNNFSSQVVNGSQTYVAEGGYFLNTLTKTQYLTAFNTDGTAKAGDINYVGFGIYVSNGSYVKNGYIDDVEPIMTICNTAYYEKATINSDDGKEVTFTMGGNNFALCFNETYLYNAFVTEGADSISFTMSAEGYDILNFQTNYNRMSLWYNDGTANKYAQTAYLDYTVANGDATVTLTKDQWLVAFDEDGTLKTSTTYGNASYENLLGIGVRFIAQYDLDGVATRIPSGTVVTFSNFTLNYAE